MYVFNRVKSDVEYYTYVTQQRSWASPLWNSDEIKRRKLTKMSTRQTFVRETGERCGGYIFGLITSPQRYILRDRRRGTTVCPACWVNGDKWIEIVCGEEKIFCTGLTKSAKVPSRGAQWTNPGRTPVICTPWVPICLIFCSQQRPPLSTVVSLLRRHWSNLLFICFQLQGFLMTSSMVSFL